SRSRTRAKTRSFFLRANPTSAAETPRFVLLVFYLGSYTRALEESTAMSISPADYTPAIQDLIRDERLAPLGPGTPNAGARSLLEALTDESLLAPHPVRDADMAAACRAGLWLYHDFIDESHSISQEIQTPTGSYWHGLMHRREPDYGNSKYWFR